MKIKIKETGKIAELAYTINGNIDCFEDWAHISECDDFEYDKEEEQWVIDQIGYDWWTARIKEEEALDDRISELREGLDATETIKLDALLFDNADYEFNDSAKIMLHVINEAFPDLTN